LQIISMEGYGMVTLHLVDWYSVSTN
jgi:hypothetical protein